MSLPPSGAQFELRHGDQRATVVEVGAALREYYAGERAVLDPFQVDAMADGGRGNVLIPWPNRLADGRYEFDGEEQQTALSEPEKQNAIHGLLRWLPWQVAALDAARVELATRLYPQKGYPFTLEVTMTYELGEDGLTVIAAATNIGLQACPYGYGQHPYLSPGAGLVDDCTLQFAAATRIETDPERQLPSGRTPVAGTPYDFTEPRAIGDFQIDDAFTDLVRDAAGRCSVRLTGADGATVQLTVDDSCSFVQLYTGDTLAPERRRQGLACEPMTCAPNAFNSGDGLVRLEPGESHSARWNVRLT